MPSLSRDPLAELGRRERQIMNVVFRLGRATVADVLAQLDDPPSYSSVRTMLRYLESKEYLRHEQEGRSYVYLPTARRDHAQKSAMSNLVRTFFDGSRARAVAALLDVDESELTEADLTRMRNVIARARDARGRER
jgi:predicted transcriptional regulator